MYLICVLSFIFYYVTGSVALSVCLFFVVGWITEKVANVFVIKFYAEVWAWPKEELFTFW